MPSNLGGWTFVIIVLAVLILFAAPKLPMLAKNVAQSLKIFRSEMKNPAEGEKSDSSDTSGGKDSNPDKE